MDAPPASPASPSSRVGLPPALTIALVVGAAWSVIDLGLWWYLDRAVRGGESAAALAWLSKVMLGGRGVSVVTSVLWAVGGFEVARRATRPAAARGARWFAGAHVASLVSIAGWQVMLDLAPSPDRGRLLAWNLGWFAISAVTIGGAMLAAGWRRSLAPGALALAAAIFLVLGGLGAFSVDSLFLDNLLLALPAQVIAVLSYLMLRQSDRDAGPRRALQDASPAVARIATALRWRMWLALAGAGLAMLAVGFRSTGMMTLMAIVLPAASVIAMVVGVIGRFEVAAVDVDGAPRTTLYVAAGIELWWLACTASPLLHLVLASEDAADLATFAIAGPLVGLVGTALLSVGLGTLARLRGQLALTLELSTTTAGYVAATLAALWLQHVAASAQSMGKLAVLMSIAAIAGMAGLAYLAAGYDRLAEALGGDAPLPAARLVR